MSRNSGNVGIISLIFIVVCTSLLSAFLTKQLAGSASSVDMEKELTDFIVKNPSIIGDAVEQAYKIQQEKEEEDAKKNVVSKKDELQNDPGSPFVGNKDAKKVLVEFFDYNCGYCKKVLPDITALLEEHKDIKIVMKEIPILGDMSAVASKISLAVFKTSPEKYWSFHNELLNSGAHTEEQILAAVTNAGLDAKKIQELSKDKDIEAQLEKHIQLARDIGIRGTPAFVAGENIVRGAQGKEALDEALK